MMHDKAWHALGVASFGLIFCACAGGDTPSTDDEFEQAVAERFRNGSVASAGGTGGRSGSGGSGQAAAGRNAGGNGPASTGGSGQLPDDDEPPSSSSGECNGFEVLAANCGSSGCHGADSTFSNFAESEAAALSFVGESGESSCAAEGPLLDPENPAASIIIQKVTASSPPCGTRMPVVGGPLSQADITCLQDWIGTL
ncbi:MAG TPA: hypothetical protein VNN80_11805 [Polyangiaceae bacterium]|jgi:hypothetical protein|nr:hypothetical protein [Polyangiaceae bacterium]